VSTVYIWTRDVKLYKPAIYFTMARSSVSGTIRDHAVVRHKYYWPEAHLTFWIIFMIITGLFLITRNADLAQEQSRLGLGTPW
jgi:hypothetical protein